MARAGPLWHPAVGGFRQPTVERLLVGVIEIDRALPRFVAMDALRGQADEYLLRLLFALRTTGLQGVEVTPEQAGAGHRHGVQVPTIDDDAGAFARAAFLPPFRPAPPADIPESKRLQGGSLARVVGADEHHGVAQLELDFGEPLEVGDGELGNHHWPSMRQTESRVW